MAIEGNRYSTHVLELVRNNGISTMDNNVDQGFLMFDYFDILVHKELKGSDKQYVNYFSIGDTFNDDREYKVSYKTLSLYCKSEIDRNPFVFVRSDTEQQGTSDTKVLSANPFLGIIQISLCKENYIRENLEPVHIDSFLIECEKKIMDMVQDVHGNQENDSTIMQLYRSSTTGDFCLVIRSDSVEEIYKIALFLNDSTRTLKVRTYTNVGIECKIYAETNGNKRYATLDKNFITAHKHMTFALRFSANCDLLPIWNEYQHKNSRGKLEAAKGLFGRYDYLLYIDLNEFSEIYPLLCEKKFGCLEQSANPYKDGEITLKNILRHPHIKNINERVLVELNFFEETDIRRDDTDAGYLNKVQQSNEKLFHRIDKLGKWRCYFAEEDRAFRDLHRGMIGIYRTFSAIGMEKDAYINWLIFCRDMNVLCECLELCLQEYENICKLKVLDETKNRTHRLRLLKDWRISIQAINQYTRLVQNINYQTYQSPIYEIQTQIDTEKTMIAYRQAMMSYMDSYIEAKDLKSLDVIPSIPIIYPDLAKDRVEVIAPFSNQKKKNGKIVPREIMCTVPSFEYFGRLYDLLPWMLHESSHHLRILARRERNLFFAEYIFSYIYRVILENELPTLADDTLYKTVGRVELRLIKCMVKVTMDDFKAKWDRNFDDIGLERLISEIDIYVGMLLSKNVDFEGKQAQRDIKEIRDKVFDFFINEYRKEGLLERDVLEKIICFKQGELEGNGDDLVEPLLDCYFNQVNKTTDTPLGNGEGIRVANTKNYQEWFEKDIIMVGTKLKVAGVMPDAIKEYLFRTVEIYRIINACKDIHSEGVSQKENTLEYLEKVFQYYQEQSQCEHWKEEDELLMNPRAVHVLRSLGLLNGDKELFCSKMQEILKKNNYIEIQKHKELKIKIYRESFADLLMATALGVGSFGYCRQVLQTLCDAGMDERGYGEDNINNHRFQIVTAVLLAEELQETAKGGPAILEDKNINQISLDGGSIIENGAIYCEYTLKCIGQKLMENWETDRSSETTKEYLGHFLGAINGQLKCFLKDVEGKENYRHTLLYILLHGKEQAAPGIVDIWNKNDFDKAMKLCQGIKYSFWRLEYFCIGLKNIMRNGRVIAPLDIFDHMKMIRLKIKKEDGKGCKWEKDWGCLVKPKMDVGDFYNDPKQVLEKTSSQKLENTIDFIQNYYYYNRFKTMKEEHEYEFCE